MKALQCEMCGSQDMVKQDGYFICQHCGTKYSVEEAKKMMIEGTVEVQGTVKIDDSDVVKKHIENARRAKRKKDWEETAKYYNLVEENDPENIEAIFFSTYAKLKQASIACDVSKLYQEYEILKNNISLIDDYYDINKSEETADVIKDISDAIITAPDDNGWVNPKVVRDPMAIAEREFIETLEKIINKDNKAYLHHLILLHCKRLVDEGPGWYDELSHFIEKSNNFLKEAEQGFEIVEIKPVPKSGGCYVATAVYGSYDCPEVWTLRRFRDYTLAESVFGRLFIRTYYAVSPTLVKWFGKTEWFKNLWKPTLDKMVAKLKADGVEDTPYEDKNW